jgi:hypothetical protein
MADIGKYEPDATTSEQRPDVIAGQRAGSRQRHRFPILPGQLFNRNLLDHAGGHRLQGRPLHQHPEPRSEIGVPAAYEVDPNVTGLNVRGCVTADPQPNVQELATT